MSTTFETRRPGEPGVAWPVNWSAVWVGALSALAVALILGLAGVAVGAEMTKPDERLTTWRNAQMGGLIWAVISAFLSFVVGGWVAGSIAGHQRSEPSMLHGSIAWLVALPLLLILIALGAGGFMGSWYTALAGTPVWVTPAAAQVQADAHAILRNNALGGLTALLLGLIGSVVGGWMASGEPMSFMYHRTRDASMPSGSTSTAS